MIITANKDPEFCFKHGLKTPVGYEENGLIKFRYECTTCNNTETRKVLIEKTKKYLWLNDYKIDREKIKVLWEKSGLLEGLKGACNPNLATLLESGPGPYPLNEK
mgnify:CR=1 FL=1